MSESINHWFNKIFLPWFLCLNFYFRHFLTTPSIQMFFFITKNNYRFNRLFVIENLLLSWYRADDGVPFIINDMKCTFRSFVIIQLLWLVFKCLLIPLFICLICLLSIRNCLFRIICFFIEAQQSGTNKQWSKSK